jgi:hypothetical protein
LIGGLFSIDAYYGELQEGAVSRIKQLERDSNPRVRISTDISQIVGRTRVYYILLGFYPLLLTAGGLGLWASLVASSGNGALPILVIGIVLLLYMVIYWCRLRAALPSGARHGSGAHQQPLPGDGVGAPAAQS